MTLTRRSVLAPPGGRGTAPYVEIVRLLIQSGANINLADNAGVAPLQHATRRNQREIAAHLKAAGAR